MAKAIAFFPWWFVDEPVVFGAARLVPYVRGRAPGDLPTATQADMDAVIEAYATRPRHVIKKAALLEVDVWHLGDDPELALERLFSARRALAFSALAGRTLFGGHFGYCNFDNFILAVQQYIEGKGNGVAFWTRRRDGRAQYYWSSDEFAFHRPLHVDTFLKAPAIDLALAALLMEPDLPSNWREAVDEYSRANTDSPDIPEHVEMVMMKSAFEVLLVLDSGAADFQRKLDALLEDLPAPSTESEGPLGDRWMARFPRSARPLQAWVREFCDRRGAAAHGAKGGDRFVWSERSHLAFASILFPLVFKKVAETRGKYVMSELDRERLRRVDTLVLHDPFGLVPVEEDGDRTHPWADFDQDVRMRTWHLENRAALLKAFDEGAGYEPPSEPAP